MIYVSHLISDTALHALKEKLSIGTESIEFSVGMNLDRLPECIEAYRKRLRRIGENRLTLHGPFLDLNPVSYDSAIAAASRTRYEGACQAAAALGAGKVVFHSCFFPDIYYTEDWVEKNIAFWMDFADHHPDQTLLLENVYDKRPEPLRRIVEGANRDNFRLCFDIGHANRFSDLPVTDWVDTYGSWTAHLHVHDNKGDADSHLGLGRGNIPFEKVLTACKKLHPGCDATIECSTAEDITLSYTRLKELGF